MASEFSTEENYFDRLPTELIISIFDKILDVKCLCVCYSVSRLFAALVPQTRFVSVQIPSAIIGSSDEILAWPPGILNFLKELHCVESVTIRFSLHDPEPIKRHQRYGPLLRWRSDSSSFIIVSAEDRIDDSTDNPTVETSSKSMSSEYYYADHFALIREHLFHFRLRFVYIKEILAVLPNLKSVSVVETTERGSVVWEENVDSMKKIKSLEDNTVFCVKLGSAPLVKLLSSGCTMKNAALISIRETECCHGLMEKISFREREYRELAIIMMKEYVCYATTVPLSTISKILGSGHNRSPFSLKESFSKHNGIILSQ